MPLQGKVGFITGGTKGIGLGIAKAMMNEGMHVAITGRKADSVAHIVDNLNSEFSSLGTKPKAIGFGCDVRDFDAQSKCIASARDQLGNIDVVIANSGVGHFASIEDLTIDQWQEVIDVNLTGVFYTTKASISALQASKGYLITIASLAGTNFFAYGSAYNASKFGLVGFTQAVMLDLRKKGIKVSTIMPGSVKTHFNSHDPDEQKDAWKIQPEDIGQMVIDLLKMNPRTLPSKIEVRPSIPPGK